MTALDRFRQSGLNARVLGTVVAGLVAATVVTSALPAAAAPTSSGNVPVSAPRAGVSAADRIAGLVGDVRRIGSAVRHSPEFTDARVSGDRKADDILAQLRTTLSRLPSPTPRDTPALSAQRGFVVKAAALLSMLAENYRAGDPDGIEASSHALDSILSEYGRPAAALAKSEKSAAPERAMPAAFKH